MELSAYDEPGTIDKLINLNINWGANFGVAVTEGERTDYTVPLADLGNREILNELILQENGDTTPPVPCTIYVDNIKFIE